MNQAPPKLKGYLRAGALAAFLSAVISISGPARAADISGAALIAASTVSNGFDQETLEQRYTLSLRQALTPYLRLTFNYNQYDLSSETENLENASYRRTSRSPRLSLNYERSDFAAQMALYGSYLEGTAERDNFEIRSFLSTVAWQPSRGPGFLLRYSEGLNVADPDVFGREARSKRFGLETFYRRYLWSVTYRFSRLLADNETEGSRFSSDQDRHELLLRGNRRFLQNRLSGNLFASLSQVSRSTEVQDDLDPAEPVPAAQGLFAIDTSPELGELDPNPSLIDGDTQTPATPRIDIGGANTFRNIGLDVRLSQPVSRLQLYVDTVSGRGVTWQIYHSPDNLVWERVEGITSSFDEELLRYTISFDQTTDRFFKAVNISSNPFPTVLVTEIRAQLTVEIDPGQSGFDSKRYRVSAGMAYRPIERVTARADVTLTNDEDLADGFVRRDFETASASAAISVGLARHLQWTANYAYTDTEDLRDPPLLRTIHRYGTGLQWTPLPTVDTILSATSREEFELETRLQSSQTVMLRAVTLILPTLQIESDFRFNRFQDLLNGSDRDSWSWGESFEAQLYRQWSVGGAFRRTVYESRNVDTAPPPIEPPIEPEPGDPFPPDPPSGPVETFTRNQYWLRSTWTPTAYIALTGTWSLFDQGTGKNINQSYSMAYTPGPRLSVYASYREYTNEDGTIGTGTSISTGAESVSVNYRFRKHLVLFGNLSRSWTEGGSGIQREVNTARVGLRLFF